MRSIKTIVIVLVFAGRPVWLTAGSANASPGQAAAKPEVKAPAVKAGPAKASWTPPKNRMGRP